MMRISNNVFSHLAITNNFFASFTSWSSFNRSRATTTAAGPAAFNNNNQYGINSWTRSLSSIGNTFNGEFQTNCSSFQCSIAQSLWWLCCKYRTKISLSLQSIESVRRDLSKWRKKLSRVIYFYRSFIYNFFFYSFVRMPTISKCYCSIRRWLEKAPLLLSRS